MVAERDARTTHMEGYPQSDPYTCGAGTDWANATSAQEAMRRHREAEVRVTFRQ